MTELSGNKDRFTTIKEAIENHGGKFLILVHPTYIQPGDSEQNITYYERLRKLSLEAPPALILEQPEDVKLSKEIFQSKQPSLWAETVSFADGEPVKGWQWLTNVLKDLNPKSVSLGGQLLSLYYNIPADQHPKGTKVFNSKFRQLFNRLGLADKTYVPFQCLGSVILHLCNDFPDTNLNLTSAVYQPHVVNFQKKGTAYPEETLVDFS